MGTKGTREYVHWGERFRGERVNSEWVRHENGRFVPCYLSGIKVLRSLTEAEGNRPYVVRITNEELSDRAFPVAGRRVRSTNCVHPIRVSNNSLRVRTPSVQHQEAVADAGCSKSDANSLSTRAPSEQHHQSLSDTASCCEPDANAARPAEWPAHAERQLANLKKRFPTHSEERVVKALRRAEFHGGKAAALLVLADSREGFDEVLHGRLGA